MAAIKDFCNKRILAIACAALFLMMTVVVSLRAHWRYTSQLAEQLRTHKSKANSSCGNRDVTVLDSCMRCTRQELRDEKAYCMETGYKQWVHCSGDDTTKNIYSWCDIDPSVEEHQFWMFEVCALIIMLVSYSVVFVRQRKNDQLLMDKIRRQIGLAT